MLEAAISHEVIVARGYYTARRLSDVPDCFPPWQRRLGLVIPSSSPAPGVHGYQLRPKRPRYKGPKYETPSGASIALDVNPLMLEEVRQGSGELWVTEGAKKVDALASRGIPAVGGTGVYMFAVPGSKGTEPLPCWRYLRTRERTVIIAFDADARTNADVQEALRRLVAMLERLGAIVLVVYVPEVDGDSKAGIDDYLAAGGSLAELRATARPFEPADIARERMSRDEKLAATIEACRRRLQNMPANSRAACSNRATMRDLVERGERSGKVTPEGLLVVRSSVDGAVGARISERAWWKSIERLEAAGELRRAKWGPNKDRPGAYLLTPWGGGSAERAHYWREATQREGQEGDREEARAQRFPLSHGPYDRSVHETRASENLKKPEIAAEVPVLRWPKVVHTWGWRRGRRVVVDSDYIARIGKQGEEVIRYLLEHEGATVAELLAEFGSRTARARDFRRRRIKPLLDRGIVAVDGEDVGLTPAWREALERAREEGDEPRDNRLQAEKAERRKQERREHFEKVRQGEIPKADSTPKLAGREQVAASLEKHRERWAAEEAGKLQPMVEPAKAFVSSIFKGLEHIRLGLLEDMWSERGGQKYHLRIALRQLRCKARAHAEYPGELFVYPPSTPVDTEAEATVTPLLRPNYRELPAEPVHADTKSATAADLEDHHDPGGDWKNHPLDCPCLRCSSPEPRYATARSAS